MGQICTGARPNSQDPHQPNTRTWRNLKGSKKETIQTPRKRQIRSFNGINFSTMAHTCTKFQSSSTLGRRDRVCQTHSHRKNREIRASRKSRLQENGRFAPLMASILVQWRTNLPSFKAPAHLGAAGRPLKVEKILD